MVVVVMTWCCKTFQARRALRALRGLVRLKLLMEGSVVKRQAANTLKCMQTLARVQSQIRSRRIRMLEETQALQRQLLQKHAKELENLRVSFFLLFAYLSIWISLIIGAIQFIVYSVGLAASYLFK